MRSVNSAYRRLADLEARVGQALSQKRAADRELAAVIAELDPRQQRIVAEDSQRLGRDQSSELSEVTRLVIDVVRARLAGNSHLANRLMTELEERTSRSNYGKRA